MSLRNPQIFLISGCFDSVWVMGQCIEELIDNILLDDTPSLACFFFKVVKYQLRLNVRLPWYEFESSDCRDKTVHHLLCWRQVALKIMVLKLNRVLRKFSWKFWTNSKDNHLYLRAWLETCLSDITCKKWRLIWLLFPLRKERQRCFTRWKRATSWLSKNCLTPEPTQKQRTRYACSSATFCHSTLWRLGLRKINIKTIS